MVGWLVSFTLVILGSLGSSTASAPISGNCRKSVWLKTEVPIAYNHACVGTCEGSYTCTDRQTEQGGTTYYYCKCLQDGVPPEPDSTACTTVVTYTPATETWDVYCYNQACAQTCHEYAVHWEPTTPCLCHQ